MVATQAAVTCFGGIGETAMKVTGLEVLRCDAGWRNYYFLKLSTDDGVVGWSEFDEGFGSPGITVVIHRLGAEIGQELAQAQKRLARADRMRALPPYVAERLCVIAVDLDPEHLDIGDRPEDLQVALGLGVEVEVE